ncbi:hypothetical protein ACLI09_17910, partial [Flavobacterium sp. RHBU_24]
YQGQEKDNEIKGEGNSLNYTFRMHDPRVGRFFAIDPLTSKYPHNSPYAFSENRIMDATELEGKEAKLIITDEVTGYAIQRVTGDTWNGNSSYLVVPTYKMMLIDAQNPNKTIATYNVTRDSWYSRGEIFYDNLLKDFVNDDYALINRNFEPAEANKNLYTGVPLEYPHDSGLDSFVLSQSGSTTLKAEPKTKEQNTFLDGTPIDDARTDLAKATGVMVHIGGIYEIDGVIHVAASYGCFGFVSTNQVYKTESDAQKVINDNNVEEQKTSNDEYKKYIKKVIKVRTETKGDKKVLISVEKRNDAKKSQIYSD